MPATFIWFLFDWRGRIGRSAYRKGVLVLALCVGALQIAPETLRPLLIGVAALQFIVQAALDAKRLHDIGFSASWVAATSLAAVGVAWAAATVYPDSLSLMADQVADAFGPDATKSPLVAIVISGLVAAAFVRSSLLWTPNSNVAGDAYAYDPLRGKFDAAGAEATSKLDADALIAQALAEKKTQDLKAALGAMQRAAPPPAGGRKTFGKRSAG